MQRGEKTGNWKIKLIHKQSSLSNEHLGRLGPFEVVDVKFASGSVFTKQYRAGDWPTKAMLAGFVMRKGCPGPEQIWHVVRYETRRGAVYRLYIMPYPRCRRCLYSNHPYGAECVTRDQGEFAKAD